MILEELLAEIVKLRGEQLRPSFHALVCHPVPEVLIVQHHLVGGNSRFHIPS